ncbi:MAG: preprotein translocase subunit SecG [Tabrizicola sp.]|uniref:preprotein translocase subunit SecG n=1 Tax=Tabrizicola sp. YIM 78059 TaxID=2529861 RepID=UPI0010A9C72B|nr:preprotein translocase subunit SecG [Tabrizicola sp. YIM 78059]
MENVVLTIHLILALLLIGVVLLQRSEGGGLGIGGGGGAMSARGQATALTKLTWLFAICFIITSITLTILATRGSNQGSVVDRVSTEAPASQTPATEAPALPPGLTGDLLPPKVGDAPATAPRADEPAPAGQSGTP